MILFSGEPWPRLQVVVMVQPYPLQTMLRIYFMQNWFGYSDPAMGEALYENQAIRYFSGLCLDINSIPDETTILNFRRLLEEHELGAMILSQVNELLKQKGLLLKQGSVMDATIIHAPSSTKNNSGSRDPEMHSTKKGKQYYFGMKAHIGVDDSSPIVHSGTPPLRMNTMLPKLTICCMARRNEYLQMRGLSRR